MCMFFVLFVALQQQASTSQQCTFDSVLHPAPARIKVGCDGDVPSHCTVLLIFILQHLLFLFPCAATHYTDFSRSSAPGGCAYAQPEIELAKVAA